MQFTSLLLGALALPIFAAAEHECESRNQGAKHNAKVVNNCPFPVFLQSVPNDGSKPSCILSIQGHGQGTYREGLVGDGSSLRLSKTRKLTHPLSFDFTPSGSRVYYDLGDQFGNPFIEHRNTLIPSKKGCAKFNCAPNDEDCYSNLATHPHIENCEKKTDLVLTLCA